MNLGASPVGCSTTREYIQVSSKSNLANNPNLSIFFTLERRHESPNDRGVNNRHGGIPSMKGFDHADLFLGTTARNDLR